MLFFRQQPNSPRQRRRLKFILIVLFLILMSASCNATDNNVRAPIEVQRDAIELYQRALSDKNYEFHYFFHQYRVLPLKDSLRKFLDTLENELISLRASKNEFGTPNEYLVGMHASRVRLLEKSSSCATAKSLEPGGYKFDSSEREILWFKLDSEKFAAGSISTVGSAVDTIIRVYDQCPDDGGVEIANHDDDVGLASRYDFVLNRERTVYVSVSSKQSGELQLQIEAFNSSISGSLSRPFVTNDSITIAANIISNGFAYPRFTITVAPSQSTYSLPVLAGRYYLSATPPIRMGVLMQVYPGVNCSAVSGQPCNYFQGTELPIGENQVVNNIDFALSAGASISGRIFPLHPSVYSSLHISNSPSFPLAIQTDPNGNFKVSGLMPETYWVKTQREMYNGVVCLQSCDLSAATPIVLGLNENRTGINLRPRLDPILFGRVDAVLTEPAVITVYDHTGVIRIVNSDMAGSYSTTFPAGVIRVSVSAKGYIPQLYDNLVCEFENNEENRCSNHPSGRPISLSIDDRMELNFQLAKKGGISGYLKGSGSIGRIEICPIDSNKPCKYGEANPGMHSIYEIRDLIPGEYFVYATSANDVDQIYPGVTCQMTSTRRCNGATTPNARSVRVLADNVTTGIDFLLEKSGTISGFTYNFVGSTLYLFRLGLESEPYASKNFYTGFSYNFNDLQPGQYRALMIPDRGRKTNVFPQLYSGRICTEVTESACTLSNGEIINVIGGQSTENINFLFASRLGVKGRVRLIGGVSSANVEVQLWQIRQPPLLPLLARTSQSLSDGRFNLEASSDPEHVGSYFLATNGPATHRNQIYSGVECAPGTSASSGTCGFAGATIIDLPALTPNQYGDIIFNLTNVGEAEAFLINGFDF